ncbi:MAG TPA: 6-phosphogluconolactonase [Polyangiaceae bacterium]
MTRASGTGNSSDVEQARRTTLDSTAVPDFAARAVARVLAEAVRARGRATLALSGGTTPRAMHESLALISGVAWDSIDVYFGDERCVPPDHPDSNYRMAKESLFDRVAIPGERIHRPEAELRDRNAAALAYEKILPPALDLVVLGIGEDGHTASLFPGSPALDPSERRCVAVIGPKPPPERLSLTPRALSDARLLLMLASGAGKAEAVARALEGEWDPRKTPAQLARRGEWILDRAAAVMLRRQD